MKLLGLVSTLSLSPTSQLSCASLIHQNLSDSSCCVIYTFTSHWGFSFSSVLLVCNPTVVWPCSTVEVCFIGIKLEMTNIHRNVLQGHISLKWQPSAWHQEQNHPVPITRNTILLMLQRTSTPIYVSLRMCICCATWVHLFVIVMFFCRMHCQASTLFKFFCLLSLWQEIGWHVEVSLPPLHLSRVRLITSTHWSSCVGYL